jgi:hypothetical protein
MTAGFLIRVGVAGGIAAAVAGLSTFASNEPAPQPPANPAIAFDVAGCVACHSGADQPGARRFRDNFKSHEFVRLNESVVWDRQDPHSLAFKVIVPEKNPLAARMQAVLAKGKPAGYRIDSDVACLTCHSTDLKPGTAGPRTPDEFARQDDLGVGCTGCHGHDARWQLAHYAELPAANTTYPAFRTRTPEQKWKDYGLRNLRDPAVKAALCASCHVGSPAEGKVVTHEMYAAGHPPLPPFELATFMEAEPRHWGYPAELPFLTELAKQKPAEAWSLYHVRPEADEISLARLLAVGAVAALKAEMQCVAAEAGKQKGGLPDFARFDCYACHHDLVIPSARQAAGYAGAPGRPPLKAWVAAVPGVVAKHAANLSTAGVKGVAGEFDAKWKAVTDASLAKPFGDAAKLAAAANDLAGWCDRFVTAVEKDPVYSPAETAKLAEELAKAAVDPKVLRDTEAVAHVTWACATLDFAAKKDAARRDAILALSPIKLPDRSKPGDKPVTVGTVLDERMKQFREFDPKKYSTKFGELK